MAKDKTISSSRNARPPVVAVLGHVDHGKTTLLDTIRNTHVAAKEHGGITQHVGAYQIEYSTKSKEKRVITFIDTPGHEAFAKIRSRGATAADIALLVVAAQDSVKPQTIESIRQIQDAGVSMIVVVNKIDLPAANIDKVKADLAKHGVQVEGFGGDVPMAQVSAKEGTGVGELLELILLVADMKDLQGSANAPTEAVVIEAMLDKFRGMTATLLVKNGTLTTGDQLYEGAQSVGKVRAMTDHSGVRIGQALPGTPVVVLGFSRLPAVGATMTTQAREAVQIPVVQVHKSTNAQDFLAQMTEATKKKLKLLIKADTLGSLEAVLDALPKEQITVVRGSVGDINEIDILDAKAVGAIVIGFNVRASGPIEKLARVEKVIFRTYTIIYKLLEEMQEVVNGMEELLVSERILGEGRIIAQFPFDKERIAGTKITSGRLAKGDLVRIMRGEEEVARTRIKSVKQGKNDVNRVDTGTECGVLFDKRVDFQLEDGIIAYTTG